MERRGTPGAAPPGRSMHWCHEVPNLPLLRCVAGGWLAWTRLAGMRLPTCAPLMLAVCFVRSPWTPSTHVASKSNFLSSWRGAVSVGLACGLRQTVNVGAVSQFTCNGPMLDLAAQCVAAELAAKLPQLWQVYQVLGGQVGVSTLSHC